MEKDKKKGRHNQTNPNQTTQILKKPSILKLRNTKNGPGWRSKGQKARSKNEFQKKKNGKTKTKKKKQKQKQLRIEKGVSPLMMWSRDDVHLFPEKNLVVCCKTICTKKRAERKETKAQMSEPYIWIKSVYENQHCIMKATHNHRIMKSWNHNIASWGQHMHAWNTFCNYAPSLVSWTLTSEKGHAPPLVSWKLTSARVWKVLHEMRKTWPSTKLGHKIQTLSPTICLHRYIQVCSSMYNFKCQTSM